MPRLSAIIQNRDFTDRPQTHWDTLVVGRYSKNATGGPKRALMRATGSQMDIWEFVETLRCPVRIWDSALAKFVWWGYIHKVDIRDGAMRWGVSLDTMHNNVAVAYTYLRTRQTTAYSSNSESATEYGTKDILLSASDISDAKAAAKRDTELANRKFPIPTFRTTGADASPSVTLGCRGWFDTLNWRYYENLLGKESYEVVGRSVREIGEDDRPIAAMSFDLSSASGWTATHIWVRAWKYKTDAGSFPTDNLKVDLYSSAGGEPNAELATASIAGASISESSIWTEFELSVPVALSAGGTTYWIVVDRSGAVNADEYYLVDTNRELGYDNGSLLLWRTDPGEWIDRYQKGDMLFRVVGELETTTQISDLNTNVGEFITATDIIDASGIDSSPFRNGDSRALREMLDLLKAGTSNSRRLLADVSIDRRMRVYEEAATQSRDNSYKVDRQGRLFGINDQRIEDTECVVAEWCYLLDVIPDTADVSKLASPSPFFIEEAEYSSRNGYQILRVRDQRDVFDIGGVTEG